MTSTPGGRRSRAIAALIACFYAGAVADWWLREKVAPPMSVVSGFSRTDPPLVRLKPDATTGLRPDATTGLRPDATLGLKPDITTDGYATVAPGRPLATTGEPAISPATSPPGEAVDILQRRALRVPIDGADVQAMKGSFDEHRSGAGGHEHDAVDILAPRNTPIHAVDDGMVAKLFYSKAGGTTIYQYDPSERFCYYYAHLERYADGLRDGQRVSRGDVVGYVGTSGNAPPGTPHLHFAVYELTPEHRWWQGRAIDPYLVFRH